MSKIKGINAVIDSLQLGRVKKLFLQSNFNNQKVLKLATSKNVDTVLIDKNEFVKLYGNNTQGCIAEVEPYKTFSLNEILESSKGKKDAVIVILDELNDPHNLGAILRSSDVFGVEGIIYKKNNQVSINSTVAKVSTGAINYVKCCEVVNLSQTIAKLKENGYWVIGLDGEAKSDLKSIPSDVPLAIVVGSEGYGISNLVKKNCDMLAKIPMQGHVSCLNASVSCAIALYQIRNK